MLAGWEHITSKKIDGKTVYAQGSGDFQGGGIKLILHTTQGSNVEGSITTLFRNRSWPHLHIDPKTKRKIQYLEVNVAAKALSNNVSDGYPTNKSNCVQIEIEGYAEKAKDWPTEDLDFIAQCLTEIRQVFYFPLKCLDPNDNRRFSDKEFHEREGIYGHKNVPDNDHTDPGQLNVPYLITKIGVSTPSKPPTEAKVQEFISYSSDIKLDENGNGWTPLAHSKGRDPVIVIPVINGNRPEKEGYPKIGGPTLAASCYDGKTIIITCVGGQPKGGFGIKVLAGW